MKIRDKEKIIERINEKKKNKQTNKNKVMMILRWSIVQELNEKNYIKLDCCQIVAGYDSRVMGFLK